MKARHIAVALASALLTIGLIPAGFAQPAPAAMPEGIEVITVVGKRSMPEGIEVITVVGKRPAPTVASTCVKEVLTGTVSGRPTDSGYAEVQAPASLPNRDAVRQAIKDCIEHAS